MFALFVVAALSLSEVRPLRTLAVPAGLESPQAGYARDAQYEYLGTPIGLFRSPRIADASRELTPFAFAGEYIHNVYVHNGALYVLKGGSFGSSSLSTKPAFLRSTDGGVTFTNLDENLRECHAGVCEYLVSTRAAFVDGRIYLNAGGNVVVSSDDGQTWSVLYGLTENGKPAAQLCPVKFSVNGDQLILGGECPLDVGWLATGTLRADRRGWAVEPRRHELPMENRNVQFIQDLGQGNVIASIEGAILRSSDAGQSFSWVLHYDLGAPDDYPYIWEVVVSSKHPGFIVAGGFDKKDATPYLTFSRNGGRSWQNVSNLLPPSAENSAIAMLAEDADGKLLAVLRDGDAFRILELIVNERPARRRSSR